MMRNKLFIMLMAAILLISVGTASAQRLIYVVENDSNAPEDLYEYATGPIYLTGMPNGEVWAESRIMVHNTLDTTVSYTNPKIHILGDGEEKVIDHCKVTPKEVPPDGYALLSFSSTDIQADMEKDLQFFASFDVEQERIAAAYYGIGRATLEKSQYSEGLHMRIDLSDLPKGVYTAIFFAMTEDYAYIWAEETTQDTAENPILSAEIEDYEVELFRKDGIELANASAVIYAR